MTAADEVAAMKAREEAATEGPWDGNDILESGIVFSQTGSIILDAFTPDRSISEAVRNADFIAHGREDMPRLIAFTEAVLALCDDFNLLECDSISALAEQHLGVGGVK